MVRVLSLALVLAGCVSDGIDASSPAPALDRSHFRCFVEPVLLARCAFFACHGTNRRPLRIYGPDKLRWDVPATERARPLTAAEEEANYDVARGFAREGPEGVPLLDKPLDVRGGGRYHGGQTLYGGSDVFESTGDCGYAWLAEWVDGGQAPADCIPTNEVGP